MNNAFEQLFDKGYQHVVIIGSDCYELTQNIIEQAFIDLEEYKVTIGPSKDGGYYLLGLSQNTPELFENIAWSTNKVYQSTIETLHKLGINYSIGPILSDIDTVDDLTDKLKLLIK
jgi:rSAM/selenodomain-associated transferase 1